LYLGHRKAEPHHAARLGDVPRQRPGHAREVDDRSRWRVQRCDAANVRLDLEEFGRRKAPQARNAVCRGARLDLGQAGKLRGVAGDDHFAAFLVGHSVFAAVLLEQPDAATAQGRLQRPWGVVDAGMGHAAVVSGLVDADPLFLVEHG
jgi:hypothetical protein